MANLLRSAGSLSLGQLFTFAVLATSAIALPAGDTEDSSPSIVKFQSKLQPDVGLRFVQNSGICETTPGVNQMSGYIDFDTNMSMVRSRCCLRCFGMSSHTPLQWFWFFEARENPETAPFTLW